LKDFTERQSRLLTSHRHSRKKLELYTDIIFFLSPVIFWYFVEEKSRQKFSTCQKPPVCYIMKLSCSFPSVYLPKKNKGKKMLDMIRSFGDNVRGFLRKFRPAARFSSRVAVKISLLDYARSNYTPIPIMNGQTFNLSSSGMALLLPDINLEGRSLVVDGTKLLVVLDLPNGIVKLQAIPIHFRRADRYVKNSGYIVGIQIVEMDSSNHSRYIRFLSRIERTETVSASTEQKKRAIA
jgi:hypothetical protein